ncbi:MAG: 50S ribosomal protein L21 [Candidatus Bostrichicola ureolyticus]|nr:MAG: 50S ribosomal protein L21 [Candidatus Bostrichicola ureolyticus]
MKFIAVVDIAGLQYKVYEGQFIYVPKLNYNLGEKIFLKKIYLLHNNNTIIVGSPIIKNFNINVQILEHLKGKKIIVFKKKRRKGYKTKHGHRQCFTKIKIISLNKN